MSTSRHSPSEAERDRTPAYRRYRDLTAVSVPTLLRHADQIGRAIVQLEDKGTGTNTQPLRDGLADCVLELIRRDVARGRQVDQRPAQDIVRVPHGYTPPSVWAFLPAGDR